MDLAVVSVIFGAGMFWTAVTLLAVRIIVTRQSESMSEWFKKIMADLEALEKADDLHTQAIHRLDVESIRLRNEMASDLRRDFVARREFDEIRTWLRELGLELKGLIQRMNQADVRNALAAAQHHNQSGDSDGRKTEA